MPLLFYVRLIVIVKLYIIIIEEEIAAPLLLFSMEGGEHMMLKYIVICVMAIGMLLCSIPIIVMMSVAVAPIIGIYTAMAMAVILPIVITNQLF